MELVQSRARRRAALARNVSFGVLVTAAFGAEEAKAQAPSLQTQITEQVLADGRLIYEPGFFAQFRPASALDMVQRVPGFTFSKGDDVRGFGGAAGNVLVDGQRPSTKTVTLDQVLQRIPVDTVQRLELVRGGAPGIDMQGQSVIVNVVRKTGADIGGAAQLLVKPYESGFVGLAPRLEGSMRQGPISLEGVVSWRRDQHTDTGDGELIRRNGAGALTTEGEFDADVLSEIANASGSFEYRRTADTFNANVFAERNETDRAETGVYVRGGQEQRERLDSDVRSDKAEIGADYQRDLASWLSGKLIGLKTFKTDTLDSVSDVGGARQVTGEELESGETIGRAVFSAVRSSTLRFEAGGEGAFNFLDAQSSLTVNGVSVVLPSANVRVEERRAEGFATANWTPMAGLSTEVGARWETSTIRQTGGAVQEKRLSFFKPRLVASYAAFPTTLLRIRLERTVGQLNFRDFAASAQVEAGTVNAGNPDLEPEKAWVGEVSVEQRFWKTAALVVTYTHSEVQDVVDLIPIQNRFDAPGNIGDGVRDEVKVSLSMPFDRLGMNGLTLRANGTWRQSSVTDPVTGRSRRISNQRPFEGDFLFSQALPSLNSSLNLEGAMGYTETAYRIGEIRRTEETPLYKIYWDWTPSPDLIFRFQIENPAAKRRIRDRLIYAGPRSQNVVSLDEHRYARQAPFLMFRVRKTY